MRTKRKVEAVLSEHEIDKIVIALADDESAWEKPQCVRRTRPEPLSLPADLAARATFLAQLHRNMSVQEWLTRIIKERVELEEAAFTEIKHELAAKSH